jgi:bifunctional UDP-N-acetylglucosamine pyrophosphorylase / glucosamine-1-phosphate N-acetyltransferase
MQLSVVILAAGQGKRMNSDLPKVLQPLADKPLLKHVIDTAAGLKPAQIHVVYGHGGDQVQLALKDEPVSWVLQSPQLGTGHAVMQAMPSIPDSHMVLVLYGDVPLTSRFTLERLLAAANLTTMSVLTVRMQNPVGYGRIVRDSAGRVRAIVEHKDAKPAELGIDEVNTGLMAVPAKRLRSWLNELRNENAQKEYYLTDIVAAAVADRAAVNGVLAATEVEVQGVNDKVQLAEVEAAYRRERARELMLAGATLADPARIDIRGEVLVGRDVYIDINCVLIGRVRLGARVKIGPHCVLRDAEIGDDTEVHSHSIVDASKVGARCSIGPFARIRPHSILADDVHIGNFVELKKTEVGAGSKANHLSYLGDAVLGGGVNVGAGTIACNYDGANKWPTIIEDGAFIGSGSMLVAPVRIGAGATIGAGSTIAKNAPPGGLTLERSKQMTLADWKRPGKLSATEQKQRIDKATKKP